MSRPAVAAWLPPALREAPDGEPGARACSTCCSRPSRASAALLEAGHRRGLGGLLHRELRGLGGAVHRRAARPAQPTRARRGRATRSRCAGARGPRPHSRTSPRCSPAGPCARSRAGRSRCGRSGSAHPPPPRVRAGRPARRLTLPRRHPVRARAPERHARRAAWSPRAATAVVWPWEVRTYLSAEAAPLPEPGRVALHPLGAEAPLYLRPRPRRVASDAGAAGSVAHRRRARRSGARDLPRDRGARRRRARSLRRQLGRSRPSTRSPQAPRATSPTLLALTRRRDAGAVGQACASARSRPARPRWHRRPPTRPSSTSRAGTSSSAPGFTGTVRATLAPSRAGRRSARSRATPRPTPAARVVVVVNPALPAGGNVVQDAGRRPSRTARALTRRPRAATDSDPEPPGRRDPARDLRPPRRPAGRRPSPPTLPRWRIVAQRLATPTVAGNLELEPRRRLRDARGLLPRRRPATRRRPRLRAHPPRDDEPRRGPPGSGRSRRVGPLPARGAVDPRRDPCRPGAPRRSSSRTASSTAAARRCASAAEIPAGAATDAVDATRHAFRPALEANGVTFAGPVRLEAADAVDCLFLDGVEVVQGQEGCLRHCYLGPDLSSPPRHPARLPLRAVPRPDVRLDRLRGCRLLRPRARAATTRCCPRRATGGRWAPTTTPAARPASQRFAGGSTSSSHSASVPALHWLPGRNDDRRLHEGPAPADDRWTGARMQQGRVLLDYDWNLNIDAAARASRALAADVIGPAGRGGRVAATSRWASRRAARST